MRPSVYHFKIPHEVEIRRRIIRSSDIWHKSYLWFFKNVPNFTSPYIYTTILKYYSRYFCQILLLIMLLPLPVYNFTRDITTLSWQLFLQCQNGVQVWNVTENERNFSAMISIANQIIHLPNLRITSLAFCPKSNNFPLTKRSGNYLILDKMSVKLSSDFSHRHLITHSN